MRPRHPSLAALAANNDGAPGGRCREDRRFPALCNRWGSVFVPSTSPRGNHDDRPRSAPAPTRTQVSAPYATSVSHLANLETHAGAPNRQRARPSRPVDRRHCGRAPQGCPKRKSDHQWMRGFRALGVARAGLRKPRLRRKAVLAARASRERIAGALRAPHRRSHQESNGGV